MLSASLNKTFPSSSFYILVFLCELYVVTNVTNMFVLVVLCMLLMSYILYESNCSVNIISE